MVSYEEFWEAYNHHKPNWLIRNYWRFFSKDTIKADSWVVKTFYVITGIMFLIGFFGTALKAPRMIIGIPTFIYGALLFLVVIPGLIAAKMNQRRTKLIAKELGISLEEYNLLVIMYWE